MIEPDVKKLAEDIETSRMEIEKLQQRVRQLVARRGKRAELVKASRILPDETPAPKNGDPRKTGAVSKPATDGLEKQYTLEEGLVVLKDTPISDVRLIAFKHGVVVLLFADDRTVSVKMDDRGPKPLLDLLAANDARLTGVNRKSPAPKAAASEARVRS